MGWLHLADITGHLGIGVVLLQAMPTQLGSFNNQIGNVAAIPDQVWRGAAAAGRIMTSAAVVGPSCGGSNIPRHTTRGDRSTWDDVAHCESHLEDAQKVENVFRKVHLPFETEIIDPFFPRVL